MSFRIDCRDCSTHHVRELPYDLFYNCLHMIFSTACEQLTALGRDFHRRGWVLGTSGNLSALLNRDPLRVAITASSVDKGRLTEDQIPEIDSEARVVNAVQRKPSAETL